MSFASWVEFARGVWRVRQKTRGSHHLAASPASFVAHAVRSLRRRRRRARELGVPIPLACMLSVTARCTLKCTGCYAQRFGAEGDIAPDVLRRVLGECADLGIPYVLAVGGEPLMVPGLIDELAAHRGTLFLLYTNCSAFDASHVRRIARAPNILPVVSIEGDAALTDDRRGTGVFAGVERAMRLMRDARVVFGFCAMVSHLNLRVVTSRAWLDWMWGYGAILGILSDYTPYPGESDGDLALTAEDRRVRRELVAERKREARPFVINFPADEYAAGGCGSAGREFIHINPQGDVEPCPLSRYASDNVNATTIRAALGSQFFTELRARSSEWGHDGEGCLLLAHERELAAIAAATGARRTDPATTAETEARR